MHVMNINYFVWLVCLIAIVVMQIKDFTHSSIIPLALLASVFLIREAFQLHQETSYSQDEHFFYLQ